MLQVVPSITYRSSFYSSSTKVMATPTAVGGRSMSLQYGSPVQLGHGMNATSQVFTSTPRLGARDGENNMSMLIDTWTPAKDVIKHMNDSQRTILLPSPVLVCDLLLLGIPEKLLAALVYAFKMNRSISGYFIMTLTVSV